MRYQEIRKKLDGFSEAQPHPFEPHAVTDAEITEAEKQLGLMFDPALKEFWLDVGYGFFRRDHPLENAGNIVLDVLGFSHPLEIVETFNRDPERFPGTIPFFDCADEEFFVIDADGKVAYASVPEIVIADNVSEFITNIFEDAHFWMKHFQPEGPSIE